MEENIYYIEVRSSKDEFIAAKIVDKKEDIKAKYCDIWKVYPSEKILVHQFNRESFYDNLCSGYKIVSFKDESTILNPVEL